MLRSGNGLCFARYLAWRAPGQPRGHQEDAPSAQVLCWRPERAREEHERSLKQPNICESRFKHLRGAPQASPSLTARPRTPSPFMLKGSRCTRL